VNPERWAELKALFQGALEQPPAGRAQWLARMCGSDQSLRRDVDALLHAHETAGDFLERPAEMVAAPAEAGPHVPEKIGPYEIQREIGRGGMGVVYLALDTRLNRRVAVKSLPEAHAANPLLRERLRREARAAATITHPGVATVYALEEAGDELFIVSEYVDGRTLHEVLKDGPIEVARARLLATEIVQALAAAHDAGVVHRDLKPENVIVTATGNIKVVDFGIARLVAANAGESVLDGDAARLTREGSRLGTPAYMAPEQLAGFGGDARTDLFAVGLILAEMVSGAHPLAPDARPLPASIATIVSRCLSPDPNGRYQSARELLADLESDRRTREQTTREDVAVLPGATAMARRWWAFHQGAAVLVYALMMAPTWSARQLIGGALGRGVFIIALAAAIVSCTLRLHAWFTSRWYPTELRRVRHRSATATRGADALLVVAMTTAGLLVSETNEPLAVLLFAVGIGIAVSFLVIEPATTRAAFRTRS
jgi:predicted Ser/Thr protein kinase